MMNDAQLDELRAIRSILGDQSVTIMADNTLVEDIDVLENTERCIGKVSVFIVIDVELSDVSVSLERAGEPVGTCGRVEHLPPVQLHASYSPLNYLSTPIDSSSAAIAFSISSCWMIGKALSVKARVEQELAELVESVDPSEPIIYSACDAVKRELEELHELAFDADDVSKMHRFLLAFDIRRRHELFRLQSHDCPICFEIKHGAQFVRFECGHAFCAECARSLATSCIDAAVANIKCPNINCRQLLQPHEIKEILGDDRLFESWNELSFKIGIASDPDFTHCPRCGGIAIEDAEENCADCAVCFWVFCSLCQESRHPGVDCVSTETKLEMLRQKAEGGSAEAVAALRRKEQELRSISLIEKTTKPCPSCGQAVERNQGCNKMTCLCGSMFCYRCGKQVEGYDHFKQGGSCILFDEAEILRWEREFQGMLADDVGPGIHENNHQEDQQRILEPRNPFVEERSRCPCCGQHNFRGSELRNHIRCWSCRTSYCASCGIQLRKGEGRTHFGPNRCAQHETRTRHIGEFHSAAPHPSPSLPSYFF